MDAADNVHVLVVDGIPIEFLLVKIQNDTNIVVGLVNSLIRNLILALFANQLAGKVCLVCGMIGIVDRAFSR